MDPTTETPNNDRSTPAAGDRQEVEDIFAAAARTAGVKVAAPAGTPAITDSEAHDSDGQTDSSEPGAGAAADNLVKTTSQVPRQELGDVSSTRGGGRLRRFAKRRPKTAVALVVVIILLIPLSTSYAKALTKPGEETAVARTAEWARDMKLGFIVDWMEQRQYATDQFTTGGTPPPNAFTPIDSASTSTKTTKLQSTTAAQIPHTPPPARMASPISPPADGEGEWTPVGPLIGGLTGVYTTKVRPNPEHPSLTVFVSWTDPLLTNIKLYPGTDLPGGEWATPNLIPPDKCPKVIIASNGGFKLNDGASRGGYFAEGRESEWKLRDGAASLVFYKDGRIDVAQWGRDLKRDALPGIESVRQNLELLVDNGQPTSATKGDGDWGAKLPNSYFVWRSGYGVTKDGALVYAGGPALKPVELAQTLINAGAVRAMEGDINPEWVHAFLYTADANGKCHGSVVLPQSEDKGGMRAKADRYLTTETRDFVVVSTK